MSLNIGPIEHVHAIHRVQLTPGPDNDAAAINARVDEVVRRTFGLGGGEFSLFSRLPLEIQDMIWEAALEPRTLRAWGCRTLVHPQDAERQSAGSDWLMVECGRDRQSYIPLYAVCQRSRAVAVGSYGLPSRDNPVPFNPALDTLEVLGHDYTETKDLPAKQRVALVAAREAGVGGIDENVVSRFRTTCDSGGNTYYWAKQLHGRLGPPRWWAVLPAPFIRARSVVLCHHARAHGGLRLISDWAGAMFPDLEEVTVRTYVGDIRGSEGGEWHRECLRSSAHALMLEGGKSWPKLRTLNFTRQCLPGDLVDGGHWD